MNSFWKIVATLLYALFFPSMTLADQIVGQHYTLPGTQVRELHSEIVGIDYRLYISLPRDYDKANSSNYPVVFLLDANYTFAMYQSIVTFLADEDELPPMILVGIGYRDVEDEKHGALFKTNRTRDYTPFHVAAGGYGPEFDKQSGGANRFLDFIEQELKPFLVANFRIKKDDFTLAGNSFGGLLGSYALLSRPGQFQRFLIVSPSLWYDKRKMFSVENSFLLSHRDLPARVFFCVGGDERASRGFTEMVGDLKSFVGKLQAQKYPKFRSQLWIAPDEGHHSVFAPAAMRGMRWLFSNSK